MSAALSVSTSRSARHTSRLSITIEGAVYGSSRAHAARLLHFYASFAGHELPPVEPLRSSPTYRS